MAEASDASLRLRAEAAADLPPLSALVQDMIVRAGDVVFDARARRLVLVGNRYRHEDPRRPSRARAGLTIGGVLTARRRGWPTDPETLLALLTVADDGDVLTLRFAAGASIKLRVECVDATLDDLTGPWGAKTTPRHD